MKKTTYRPVFTCTNSGKGTTGLNSTAGSNSSIWSELLLSLDGDVLSVSKTFCPVPFQPWKLKHLYYFIERKKSLPLGTHSLHSRITKNYVKKAWYSCEQRLSHAFKKYS